MTGQPAYTDADVQTCIDWLYSAMHDDRQVPEMAENLLEDLVPRIMARAKAEALRDEAARLRRMADHGADGEATPYEIADWLTTRADEIEAGR